MYHLLYLTKFNSFYYISLGTKPSFFSPELVVLLLCNTIWIRRKGCSLGGNHSKGASGRGGLSSEEGSAGVRCCPGHQLIRSCNIPAKTWIHTQTGSRLELNSPFIYTSWIFKSRRGIISSSRISCLKSKTELALCPKILCLLKVFSTEASSPELKTWRNGKSTASRGSLFHWLITLTMEQLYLISHAKSAWLQLLPSLLAVFLSAKIDMVVLPCKNKLLSSHLLVCLCFLKK